MPINKSLHNKKALILVNLLGFITFLENDFRLMTELGYEYEIAGNGKMADGTDAIEISMLSETGVPFHQIDFDTKKPLTRQNVDAYRDIKCLIDQNHYNLIICHTPIPGLLARFAARSARRLGAKVVYVTHGFSFAGYVGRKAKVVYRAIENVMSRYCDAIITINHDDYIAAKCMHAAEVFYIPGVGVDTRAIHETEIDRAAFRGSLGLSPNDIAVLCVGELSERKNQVQAIRAIGLLEDRSRHVLLICGRSVTNSNIEIMLEKEAQLYGVNLILLGHRNDVIKIMKACDLLVLPSLREGLGLAGIEALAAGIPVIGSDVQGIRDYIQDGVNGYLCVPGHDEEWAKAIKLAERRLDSERSLVADCCFESSKPFDRSHSYTALKQAYKEILKLERVNII